MTPAPGLSPWRIVDQAETRAVNAARSATPAPRCEPAWDPVIVLAEGPVGRWLLTDGRAIPYGHGEVVMLVVPGCAAEACRVSATAIPYAEEFVRTLYEHRVPAWIEYRPRPANPAADDENVDATAGNGARVWGVGTSA